MRSIQLFIMILLLSSGKIHAQISIGYHQSFLKYNMKGLSYDFFQFNNTGEGHTSYLRPGSFKGLSIGFYDNLTDDFSVGMGIRTRRYTTTGEREIAPTGQPNKLSIRVRNTSFFTSIGLNIKEFTIGYEIEIGRLRVDELEDDAEDWRKLSSNRPVVGCIGLYALFRPEIEDQLLGFIKAYWRPAFSTTTLYGNEFMERDRYMRIGQVGFEIGLNYISDQ